MTIKLETDEKVVGIKQVRKALLDGYVRKIYIAEDAEKDLVNQIIQISKERQIQIKHVESMRELGKACNIDVNAAVAALLK